MQLHSSPLCPISGHQSRVHHLSSTAPLQDVADCPQSSLLQAEQDKLSENSMGWGKGEHRSKSLGLIACYVSSVRGLFEMLAFLRLGSLTIKGISDGTQYILIKSLTNL